MIEVSYVKNKEFTIVMANRIRVTEEKVLIWTYGNSMDKIPHDNIISIIGQSGQMYSLDVLFNYHKEE